MSSNRPSFFRTLRSRLLLGLIGAFAIVLLAGLVFLQYFFLKNADDHVEKEIDVFVHVYNAKYLLGGRIPGAMQILEVDGLPDDAEAEFHRRHPEARIAEVFDGEGDLYWFCASQGPTSIVARVGFDVSAMETFVTVPDDRRKAVRESFSQSVLYRQNCSVYHLLLSPDASEVLERSLMPDEALPVLWGLGKSFSPESENPETGFVRVGGERCRYRVARFFDDTLFVTIHGFDNSRVQSIFRAALTSLILLFALSVLLAWWVSGYTLRALRRLSDAARAVRGGNFDVKVAPIPGDAVELEQTVGAFNEMIDRVRASIEDQRLLTDNIAHDLKTPISHLRSRAELTLYGKEPESKLAESVAEECSAMLSMINATLEISRAHSDLRTGLVGETDLSAVIREAADLFAPAAESAGLRIRTGLPEASVRVSANKVRIQRVVGNLLDNALKFTDAGGSVSLDLSIEGPMAKLTVTDTGRGIPSDAFPNLFKRFYRADESRTVAGHGLGLALARAYVEMYGGSISAANSPRGGAVFTVMLPLVKE